MTALEQVLAWAEQPTGDDDERIAEFTYQAVDVHKEIRLLHIEDDSEDSIISCSITTARPETAWFAALSYTWGEDALVDTVLCDGTFLKVTANCYAAFAALRRSHYDGAIWIDAVCINQANMEERSVQVSRMGEIYKRAAVVVVHPGNEYLISREEDAYYRSYRGIPWQIFQRNFLLSPWLKRTWVIQEVMLAKKIVIFVTPYRNMDWRCVLACPIQSMPTVFHQRAMFYPEYGQDVAGQSGSDRPSGTGQENRKSQDSSTWWRSSALATLQRTQKWDMNLNWWRLFDLLKTTRHFGCRDPRDKLFALLSLFQGPIPHLLFPDYSKSVVEVYTDLSWFLIDYDIPDSLALAGGHGPQDSFPSWVVDWSSSSRVYSLEGSRDRKDHVWRAGFSLGTRRIYASRSLNVLTLRGMLAGEVHQPVEGSSLLYVFRQELRDLIQIERARYTLSGLVGGELQWVDGDWIARCVRRMLPGLKGKRLFSVDRYGIGLLPLAAQCGDRIVLFLGFRTPFVIRPVGEVWNLVGECCVIGLMEGQLSDTIDWSGVDANVPKAPLRDFRIR